MQAAVNRLPGAQRRRRADNPGAKPHIATADDTGLLDALPIAAAIIEQNGENITASLPDDMTPADITNEIADALFAQKKRGPVALGNDSETGLPVYSMIGPFGRPALRQPLRRGFHVRVPLAAAVPRSLARCRLDGGR